MLCFHSIHSEDVEHVLFLSRNCSRNFSRDILSSNQAEKPCLHWQWEFRLSVLSCDSGVVSFLDITIHAAACCAATCVYHFLDKRRCWYWFHFGESNACAYTLNNSPFHSQTQSALILSHSTLDFSHTHITCALSLSHTQTLSRTQMQSLTLSHACMMNPFTLLSSLILFHTLLWFLSHTHTHRMHSVSHTLSSAHTQSLTLYHTSTHTHSVSVSHNPNTRSLPLSSLLWDPGQTNSNHEAKNK